MSIAPVISPGSRVLLNFSLSLEDGTEVISTFTDEPMAFILGDGTLEAALESKLLGQKSGDEQSLVLSGDEIYGSYEPENRQWIGIDEFPAHIELSEGQVIAFTTPAGDALAGSVAELESNRVLIDFNHPLSGRTIIFRTAILEVQPQE